mmetsp:Transcript_20841/g.51343  ORF Transcript_20841/g.51343 Transcript_20841/m.51343 type:complete len:206 (+) Transcript_20841:638-1255(+)
MPGELSCSAWESRSARRNAAARRRRKPGSSASSFSARAGGGASKVEEYARAAAAGARCKKLSMRRFLAYGSSSVGCPLIARKLALAVQPKLPTQHTAPMTSLVPSSLAASSARLPAMLAPTTATCPPRGFSTGSSATALTHPQNTCRLSPVTSSAAIGATFGTTATNPTPDSARASTTILGSLFPNGLIPWHTTTVPTGGAPPGQ